MLDIDRSTYSVAHRSKTLHYSKFYDIMLTYLSHVKGGYSEHNDGRIVNRKGGSEEVEVVGGSRETPTQKQAASRLYRSRFLAHQAGRCERVPRTTIQHQTRGKLTHKLTSLSATATRYILVSQAVRIHLVWVLLPVCSIAYLVGQCKQARACYLFVRKRDVL